MLCHLLHLPSLAHCHLLSFLEYVPGGTIRSCLNTHGKFKEEVTKSFTSQILQGLSYLHSKSILHRVSRYKHILLQDLLRLFAGFEI